MIIKMDKFYYLFSIYINLYKMFIATYLFVPLLFQMLSIAQQELLKPKCTTN